MTSNVIGIGASTDTTTRDYTTDPDKRYDVIVRGGRVFQRMPTLTKPANNSTILEDSTGAKFAMNGFQYVEGVEDVNVNDPPADPQVGQAWVVGPAPTGDWASYPKHIVVWTDAYDWEEEPPEFAREVRNRRDGLKYYYANDNTWTLDVVGSNIGNSQLRTVQLADPFGSRVAGIVNSPPSASGDITVVVGTTPTGIFTGRNNQVAVRQSNTWSYRPPQDEEQIAIIAGTDRGKRFRWDGTSWTETGLINPIVDWDPLTIGIGSFQNLNTPVLTIFEKQLSNAVDFLYVDIEDMQVQAQIHETDPAIPRIVSNRTQFVLQMLIGTEVAIEIPVSLTPLATPALIDLSRPLTATFAGTGDPKFFRINLKESRFGVLGQTMKWQMGYNYGYDVNTQRYSATPQSPNPLMTFSNVLSAKGFLSIEHRVS